MTQWIFENDREISWQFLKFNSQVWWGRHREPCSKQGIIPGCLGDWIYTNLSMPKEQHQRLNNIDTYVGVVASTKNHTISCCNKKIIVIWSQREEGTQCVHMRFRDTGIHDSYPRKKAGKSNHLWKQSAVRLNRKNFKIVIINTFKVVKENIIKEVKKCKMTMSHQILNINRHTIF